MTSAEIIQKLESLTNEGTKKVLLKHGAREPFYGVKIDELKKIQKVTKKNYSLSLELYDSGISDAMYLAGLIADETKMTKQDLQKWVEKAFWPMLSESTVAWVAAESRYGMELGLAWIDSLEESIASSGWATLAGLASLKPDDELDMITLEELLRRVEIKIHEQPNRVRYTMNGFVIAIGTYVRPLTAQARKTAQKIGKVSVNMGDTACKVPSAVEYIDNAITKNSGGVKKKTVRC